MKITVYTITDCKFSQAEKQYLQSKGLQFEEKNLEANREYLTEMLNISNNFAGTPVTKIEKDDGQIIVLKGYTQDEFDKALAVDPNAPAKQVQPQDTAVVTPQPAAAAPLPQNQQSVQPAPTPQTQQMQPDMNSQPMQAPQPAPQAPMMDVQQPQMAQPPMNPPQDMTNQMPPAPPVQMAQPMPQQTAPPMDMQQPPSPPADNQALNSVLQNLQSRAGDTTQ